VDHSTYCATRCFAKCCIARDVKNDGDVMCPQLNSDCSCAIYADRFAPGQPDVAQVAVYESKQKRSGLPIFKPFFCGRISWVLENERLPDWVKDGCCYVHPELLKETEQDFT
jgi:hypothetical protein